MHDPIRLAILNHAIDAAMLWELPWGITELVSGEAIEVHPRRTVGGVRPVLGQLLRDGHVSIYPDDSDAGSIPLNDALVLIEDDSYWDPTTAEVPYAVATTPTGEREYDL